MCVFTLKQIIEFYMHKGSPVYVCFLDASKAFDRVNHWCLFSKLAKRGIDTAILRLLVYWYTNQTFCVRWGNTLSSFFTVTNGVRQGGVMSPALFNVYMDDLSKALNNSHIGCYLNGTSFNNLFYADDTCIIAPSPSALQKLLNICSDFAQNNGVIFNETKTKCMIFKPRQLSDLFVPKLCLNGKPLKCVHSNKYLGIILSSDYTDNGDILKCVKSIYTRGNMITKSFKMCSDTVKHYLFRSYFSNAYCCQLWSTYKSACLKKAVVAYNDVYRKLFNIARGHSISAIYVTNSIDSFNVLLRKHAYSFTTRLLNCDNELVSCVTNSLFFLLKSTLKQKWYSMLY